MTRLINGKVLLTVLLMATWLGSGFFIVRGNEQAVVRRFGRLHRNAGGAPAVRPSGLRWDLPWPLATIDCVNSREIRTLTVGLADVDPTLQGDEADAFLKPIDPARQAQFLTGDRNILNLQVTVHYRIGEIGEYLYGSTSPESRLKLLVESLVADVVTRSGVDFVHVLGRTRLRQLLLSQLTQVTPDAQLGLAVEDVTIGGIYPPTQVKAEFLEVMNARAERETYINNATAYARKRTYEQEAQAEKITLEANGYRSKTVEMAKGSASRFEQFVGRLRRESGSDRQDYVAVRQLAMRRLYIETLQDVFSQVAGKVLLDSGRHIDLTIFRERKQ